MRLFHQVLRQGGDIGPASTMTEVSLKERIGRNLPPCLRALGGEVVTVDQSDASAELSFEMPPQFCHSGDIVQGGFVTGMLDGTMSMAAFAYPSLHSDDDSTPPPT
ncbi:MAG: hypothetical protein ACR2P1_20830 [Pseudomonadales bacterium]